MSKPVEAKMTQQALADVLTKFLSIQQRTSHIKVHEVVKMLELNPNKVIEFATMYVPEEN